MHTLLAYLMLLPKANEFSQPVVHPSTLILVYCW